METVFIEFREAVGLISDLAIILIGLAIYKLDKRVSKIETIQEERAK